LNIIFVINFKFPYAAFEIAARAFTQLCTIHAKLLFLNENEENANVHANEMRVLSNRFN
jgi:hypothetical protein